MTAEPPRAARPSPGATPWSPATSRSWVGRSWPRRLITAPEAQMIGRTAADVLAEIVEYDADPDPRTGRELACSRAFTRGRPGSPRPRPP